MRRVVLYSVLGLALASGNAQAADPPTPESRGLSLAYRLDRANEGFLGESAQLEMVLVNAQGEEIRRRMRSKTREGEKDGDKSIITFEWPADVKGTRMLTWTHKEGSDDQWLYLPAIRRIKRITSRNKSGAFMGSEFAYEDLASQEVEKYTYKYLEETKEGERAVWRFERIPVDKRSGYSRQVVTADQEYMNPTRIEYFDRKGELLKVAEFLAYTKISGFWRPGSIHMRNVQTKKVSVLQWRERKLKLRLSDETFDSEALHD